MSEELFAAARGNMRIALAVIFVLFILCFIAIIVEELFLGGRRRRIAEKNARERAEKDSATSDPAPQS